MAPETETTDPGKTLLSWQFPEYEQHDRSPGWYILAVLITLGLLVWALVTANFLFAVIILFGAILLFRQHRTHPERLTFSITEHGIDVHGRHFFRYDEIRSFWIVGDRDVRRLYFDFTMALRPRLTVPLEDTDPEKVRKTLSHYLKEDKDREDEPVTDAVARLLKL